MLYGEVPCPNLFGSQSANQTEKRLLINKLQLFPFFVDKYFYTHMYARLISIGAIFV